MVNKKVVLTSLVAQYERSRVASWKPLANLFLLLAAGAFAVLSWRTFPASEGWGSVLFLLCLVCFITGAISQGDFVRLLIFLEKGHFPNSITIREECVGPDEARARLVEFAQEMHRVDQKQIENREAMKTAANPEARNHHRQVDEDYSKEFKGLQDRFYPLHRALVAEGYPLDPNARFTDYLFPFPKEKTPPPASTPLSEGEAADGLWDDELTRQGVPQSGFNAGAESWLR